MKRGFEEWHARTPHSSEGAEDWQRICSNFSKFPLGGDHVQLTYRMQIKTS